MIEETAKIRAHAQLVIDLLRPLSHIDFGYNAASVAWVDGFIERQRREAHMTPDKTESLVQRLGCFVGECIIAVHGGEWHRDHEGLCVRLSGRSTAYPFHQVSKQFENGAEDSVAAFFEALGALIAKRQMN